MSPDQVATVLPVLRPLAVRWAASYVGAQDAEDVAQSALAVLLERAADVEPAAVEAFLRTTVWKAASTHRRRHGREVVVGPADFPEAEAPPAPDPEVTLVSAQISERVRTAMDEIASSRLRILKAVAIDERPVAEVAREEGIPESTARARRDAAEEDLRASLHRQRVEERRRTGGFASWSFLPLMDVRAGWRRALALLGATATAAAVAGGVRLHIPALGPTEIEAPARAVVIDTVRPVTALPSAVREPSVSPGGVRADASLTHRSRTRHDAGAHFAAERFGR